MTAPGRDKSEFAPNRFTIADGFAKIHKNSAVPLGNDWETIVEIEWGRKGGFHAMVC